MRILIGYNGSEASIAALADLEFAGLPDETEAVVLTVTEADNTPKNIDEARRISSAAAAKIRNWFPKWSVFEETASGSPAREILAHSKIFKPDLIVVGEPRHDLGEHNMFIGHTSQVLLTESECTVRIARNIAPINSRPGRKIVGFDGSVGSLRAVESIALRKWPPGTEVRLLAVADSSVLDSIGRFTPQMKGAAVETKFASQWAETLAATSSDNLKRAGISSSVEVRLGHPKDVIIKEAESWNADTIFVGPNCSGRPFERCMIGSTSAAVAARANCSVEVVRCPGE
jgi:nucleotide-binding universal stress UspA family protein